MHTNEPREIQGVELGYDPRDIESKPVRGFFIAFFIFTVVAFGAGAWIYVAMDLGGRSSFDTRKPRIEGPLVQGNITSKTDIMSLRQYERRMMTTYEPLPNGKWRIPVDHAIELLGSRGLPTIASNAPAISKGTTIEQNAVRPNATPTTAPAQTQP